MEAEVEFDCETPGTFPDPEFCMKFIRCNKKLFVRNFYLFECGGMRNVFFFCEMIFGLPLTY